MDQTNLFSFAKGIASKVATLEKDEVQLEEERRQERLKQLQEETKEVDNANEPTSVRSTTPVVAAPSAVDSTVAKQMDELRRLVQRTEREKEKLRKELQQEKEQTQSSADELQLRLQETEELLAKTNEKLTEAESSTRAVEQQKSQQVENYEALQMELAKKQEELESLRSKNQRLQKDIRTTSAKLQEAQEYASEQMLAAGNEGEASAYQELIQSDLRLRTMETELAMKTREVGAQQAQLDLQKAANEAIHEELAEKDTTIRELKDQIDSLLSQMANESHVALEMEIQRLKKAVDDRDARFAEQERTHREERCELESHWRKERQRLLKAAQQPQPQPATDSGTKQRHISLHPPTTTPQPLTLSSILAHPITQQVKTFAQQRPSLAAVILILLIMIMYYGVGSHKVSRLSRRSSHMVPLDAYNRQHGHTTATTTVEKQPQEQQNTTRKLVDAHGTAALPTQNKATAAGG
eukprot:TRINITY_DN53849_c0_g2_i1.p1 TRINITY_DN53849_c0_g2~~TRINITY_DN53849_c0_g2_i1.p1  ORF type:complete len:468 (-),score=67.79 TRINITY_DN53849_c0_g2_i1:175-1578(-)